jgi:hypothetical protein
VQDLFTLLFQFAPVRGCGKRVPIDITLSMVRSILGTIAANERAEQKPLRLISRWQFVEVHELSSQQGVEKDAKSP